MWRTDGRTIVPVIPSGAKTFSSHEDVEILPRRALHDDRREPEGRVVVVPLGARDVLELRLALHDLDDLRAADPVATVEAAAGHAQQIEELAQAGGVGDEVTHLDGVVEFGQLGDVGADVVVEGQVAAFGLEHDREGGELLRGRADVGAGVGGEGDAVGQVGHPVGLRVEGLAVAPNPDGGPGRMVAVEARHHLVGEFFRVGRDVFALEQRDFVVA